MENSDARKYTKRKALVTGTILLGIGLFFSQAKAFECGAILPKGYHKLTEDVTCFAVDSESPALTLESGSHLDLNGFSVDCTNPFGNEREGIVLEGRNAIVRNGIITNCYNGVVINGDGHHKVLRLIVENNSREGMRVRSTYNRVINVESLNNVRRGFSIDGDDNSLINCLAENNGRQGFLIEGRDNKIINSDAFDSCRDGIEIDGGHDNSLTNNHVSDNGNPETCLNFGEAYNPSAYAGIDIRDGSEENIVKNNRTSGNQGCNGEDCVARERNLWDENVDVNGYCDSTNRWINNRVDGRKAHPECGQN